MVCTKKSIEEYGKKNKEIAENTNLLIRKYEEFEKYNKNLLEKIKELYEEKKKIEVDENEKKKEIEKKCEDFKNDVKEKFSGNFPDMEKLKEDNNYLQSKLDEYLENTEKIRENIMQQIQLKEEATLETKKKSDEEIKMKLSMHENSCNNIREENKKLSAESTKLRNDANDKVDKINKIAKDFDIKKKEYEKVKNKNK
jgi:hypothetical protein